MPGRSRHGTCVHEAGHAVVSYLLGVRFLHIAVMDDAQGEVVPESAAVPLASSTTSGRGHRLTPTPARFRTIFDGRLRLRWRGKLPRRSWPQRVA
jgi:hypothetical protein